MLRPMLAALAAALSAQATDPAAAAAYARVGAAEESLGHLDTAAAAYAQALRLDPENGEARKGLQRSRPAPAADEGDALAKMNAGDFAGAAAQLARARAARA